MTDAMTDEMRDTFQRDGFVVVANAVRVELLEAIRAEIVRFFSLAAGLDELDTAEDLASPAFHDLLYRLFKSDFDAYHGAARLSNHAVSLHRLGTDPTLIELLRSVGVALPAICARPVVWFHSPRLATAPRYHRLPAHQEWSNMQGSLDGAVVWTPLIFLSPEMGLLQVVPGSHTDGLRPLAPDAQADYPLSMAMDGLSDADFTDVEVPVGSALIFSPFLVHRSGENRSDLARITANFRFNNAADPSFVARHFINPFRYEAPAKLMTPGFPPAGLIRETRG